MPVNCGSGGLPATERCTHHEVGRVRELLLHRAAVAHGKDVLLARLEPIVDLHVKMMVTCSAMLQKISLLDNESEELTCVLTDAREGSSICCRRRNREQAIVATPEHAVQAQSRACSRISNGAR